jgi:putative Mn2+ efflux pump MntP
MENFLTTVVLAFSMSADAFAAALGKGAALGRPRLREALRTGFVFGIIEAITPVMGWAAGLALYHRNRSLDRLRSTRCHRR